MPAVLIVITWARAASTGRNSLTLRLTNIRRRPPVVFPWRTVGQLGPLLPSRCAVLVLGFRVQIGALGC